MKVKRVDTEKSRDVQQFIELPFRLYQDSSRWVPPLVSGMKTTLDREKHPFYNHSKADFFLVEDAGDAVGRIAVLANRHYNDYHKERVAFFYYFDAIDDREVSRALFEAAFNWARAEGLDTVIGPKGFLRSDGMGILIEGHEHPGVFGIPYNYPYYASHVESLGFEKEIDYLSGYLAGDYELPERFFELAERVKKRRGFWVKSFSSKQELRGWIPRIQHVNNTAFTQVWGYYPLNDAEAQMIGNQLLTVIDPALIKLVLKEDELAGFILAFPDLSDALKKSRGRLLPWGWLRLMLASRRTRRLVGNGLGLLPKYQGLGANLMLYVELHKTVKERNAEFCNVVQVAENNVKSLGDMAAAGVEWHKRHRIYRHHL